MVNVSAIKAEMARNDYTVKKLAKKMGISEKTFSRKLKRGVFGTDEAEIMIRELKIKEPMSIFFAD